ncbi:MAG: hypothetical protein ACI92S_004358, partial [Planctomycetaceae bacterium]
QLREVILKPPLGQGGDQHIAVMKTQTPALIAAADPEIHSDHLSL